MMIMAGDPHVCHLARGRKRSRVNQPFRQCITLNHTQTPVNGYVESANNEVTARRQKRNGMSWSKAGSQALTALSVLVCNRCQAIWVRKHTIPLRFVNKAA